MVLFLPLLLLLILACPVRGLSRALSGSHGSSSVHSFRRRPRSGQPLLKSTRLSRCGNPDLVRSKKPALPIRYLGIGGSRPARLGLAGDPGVANPSSAIGSDFKF